MFSANVKYFQSYEDMMEDPHLPNLYSAKATNEETYNKRQCWVLELSAKKEEIAYNRRQIWVDKVRFIILRENLFAKGGMLLKTMDMREITEVQNHWIAKSVLYIKMSSKKGKGQNSSSILLFSIRTYLIISF
jgi:hypothetical protein